MFKVSFYVPSTNFNERISERDFILRVAEIEILFTNLYGGATADKSVKQGRYRAADGEVITEDVIVVSSLTEDLKKSQLLPAIEELKKEWQQESLLIEIQTVDDVLFI